mmetsp:Transcript_22010/g.40448  ORF Transcript_22010/g.40448 Transcript_22010/m.40448 type:complete len:263 (-) Transcript_22010:69-857(-)
MPPKAAAKVLACSGLASSGSILKEGGETYDASLKLEDAAANHKKFYNMQVIQSKDKTKYWFVQQWGRIGTAGQHQVKGPSSKDVAVKLMLQKFRQKAGVKFEDRGRGGAAAPGSTATTGKYEMLDRRLNQAKAGRARKKGSVAISLMWDNSKKSKTNDLDLWVTPPSKEKVWYQHKKSACGGKLDVDRMQDCKEPVENVVWLKNAPKGEYKVQVQNFSANHSGSVKFDVGICLNGGETEMLSKTVPGKSKSIVQVKKFKYNG